MKRILLILILLMLLPATQSFCCFGPKLYVGADDSPRQQFFYALVSLYIKEKTGTESELVPADAAVPLALLAEDRADLVFVAPEKSADRTVLFEVEGLPLIVSGPRPVEDLQFTLVGPALSKLSRLLTAEKFNPQLERVVSGAPPAATARAFLTEQGWL